MKDVLQEIIANTKIEVEQSKKELSLEELKQECRAPYKRISMRESLEKSPSGIISEFKRRSPSKGWIKREGVASEITSQYQKAGASALSILTDESYFGGTMGDIISSREGVELPILRKDFIIDEYQIYEARKIGANAILLIAAALEVEQCRELAEKAHELELEVLLEIHSEGELTHVNEYVDMVGVNNRNLGSFHTDVQNSFNLISKLPKDILLVSESGISNSETVKELRNAGFKGFLIGENFMRTDSPGDELAKFINDILC